MMMPILDPKITHPSRRRHPAPRQIALILLLLVVGRRVAFVAGTRVIAFISLCAF